MPKIKIAQPYIFDRLNKEIQNRTVLAAMTNKQSYENGIVSDDEIKWLLERAKGGFGIITTAATNISKEGKAWDGEFGVYDDLHIPNLSKLTSAIHQTNSLVIAQLFHGGLKCPQKITGSVPISSSEIKCKESYTGKSKQASEKEIKKIINDFTMSAIRCHQAGFDGVELHAAHGYLLSQFLGKKTNLRTDNWGGELKNRSRLIVEILKSIRESISDPFMVGVRISPEIESLGIELNDSINLIDILRKESIDFIHLSCWDVFAKLNSISNNKKTLTEIIRGSYEKLPAIISTGNVWSSLDAKKLLNQGADLVGVGRVAIGHPNWANNVSNISYQPSRPPFTADELKKAKLSKTFISYMKNWDGSVKE